MAFSSVIRPAQRISLLASAATILAVAPAQAQDRAAPDQAEAQGNVIIVTATKRDSTLQDVPFSINALTEKDIQRANVGTLEDLSRNVAGLIIQNLGPGQSQVSVRGISAGQIVRDQPGVKEQVGIYIDETVISLSLFTPDLDLFDLNRMETLRGPQGTLFGSGSVGGTIRNISNQPKLGVTEGLVESNLNLIDGGNAGGHLKGAINLPLGNNAAVRAVGYYTRYAGFIDAIGPAAGQNVNDGDRYGGRIAITIEPNDNIVITPRVIYQKVIANGFNRQEVFSLLANTFTTTRPQVVFNEREQFLAQRERFEDETVIADLKLEADVGPVTLTSVSSYTKRNILVSRDATALTGSVSVSFRFPEAAVVLPSNLRDTTELETITQEVRIASNSEGAFQWLLGAFYSDIQREYAQRLPTPGYDAFADSVRGPGASARAANGFPADSPFNSDLPFSLQQLAVFGEASYQLSPALTFTAGGRYYGFEEVRTITTGGLFAARNTGRVDSTRSDGFTPRFLLSYRASDELTVNAQASQGFRLGGVNDPLNIPLCNPQDLALFGGFQSFGDETLWNYELGVKSQGKGFTFNAAAFYNDISNLQVTLDAGSCSSRIVFNVPESFAAGVEVELGVSPTPGLALNVSGSYIASQFQSTLPGELAVVTGIREGNRLPSVPEFQVSMNGSYEWKLSPSTLGFVTGSFQHVGNRFTQPADQENNPRVFVHNLPFAGMPASAATTLDLLLPAYNLVNLSAGVELDSGLSVTAYINNVFDENPLFSFDRERGGRARLGFHVGQPRTFGVTVRQSF